MATASEDEATAALIAAVVVVVVEIREDADRVRSE